VRIRTAPDGGVDLLLDPVEVGFLQTLPE